MQAVELERHRAGLAPAAAQGTATLLIAVVLGFGIALLTVAWPMIGLALSFALGGAVVLVRRPQWVWFCFTASLAIPVQKTVAGIPVNASDALLVFWCVLWPLILLRQDTPSLRTLTVPTIVKAISPFLLAVALSQSVSMSAMVSAKQGLRIIEWFVVLPVLVLVFRPTRRYWQFASVMLLVIPCFFAVDGLVEVALNGQSLTHMMGIDVPLPEGSLEQIRHTFDISGRAGSTFGGAQGLAMYLVMSMSVVLAHVLRPPSPGMRLLALVSTVVCTAGLAATQSRGGLLGAAVLVLVLTLAMRPQWTRIAVALVVAVAFALTLALALVPQWDGTVAGLVPGRPEAVLDRLIIWGVVLDVVQAHPLLGVGLGNFRDEFFARGVQLHVELGYSSVHAHNTFLEILAGTGLIGLAAYLFFLGMVGRHLVRLWKAKDSASQVFTLAALGALGAYVVFAMVDMLLLQNMHMLLVTVLTLGLSHQQAPAPGISAAMSAVRKETA